MTAEITDPVSPQFVECNGLALRRASRAIGQIYDQHLAQVGLRGGQYSILSHLLKMGPMGINALATNIGMDRTTLNRVLKPLERDGLVEIGDSATDRRSKELRVTPAGEALQIKARAYWEAAQAAFETTYGVNESAQLRAMLKPLRSGLPSVHPGEPQAQGATTD